MPTNSLGRPFPGAGPSFFYVRILFGVVHSRCASFPRKAERPRGGPWQDESVRTLLTAVSIAVSLACPAFPSAAGVPRATGAAPARGATRTSAREQTGREQTANEQTGREDDAVLRRAWRKLSAEARLDLALWFTAEARALDTFQETLLQFVVRRPERDPYDWPEAADHEPLYAAREHTPAQVIRRRPLSPRSRRARDWAAKVFGPTQRRLKTAWTYDYGLRTVERVSEREDPERIFENALAGFPPDLDLAEAMVERALDDGSQHKLLAAFAHAYADRAGRAYPGVTLYDAWGSGLEIEMPDVECLGLLHDILGDWGTWVAPIPAARQDSLYDKLRGLFVEARAYRGLRSALARTFLTGEPSVEVGYGPALDRLHGLWESFRSDPAALSAALPPSADHSLWLARMGAEAKGADGRWRAGQRRKATLIADRARVRAALVRVMRQSGALDD